MGGWSGSGWATRSWTGWSSPCSAGCTPGGPTGCRSPRPCRGCMRRRSGTTLAAAVGGAGRLAAAAGRTGLRQCPWWTEPPRRRRGRPAGARVRLGPAVASSPVPPAWQLSRLDPRRRGARRRRGRARGAGHARRPLARGVPTAAASRGALDYASVALVTLALPPGDRAARTVRVPGAGERGIRGEGGDVRHDEVAAGRDGAVLVRASLGRYGEERRCSVPTTGWSRWSGRAAATARTAAAGSGRGTGEPLGRRAAAVRSRSPGSGRRARAAAGDARHWPAPHSTASASPPVCGRARPPRRRSGQRWPAEPGVAAEPRVAAVLVGGG